MSYIKNTFVRFKEFVLCSTMVITNIITQLSFKNLQEIFRIEYKDFKDKLKDLKATNWELAQYHFIAGNYSDAIMRFKVLQRKNYKLTECNYFLGRIYIEKRAYVKAKIYLDAYILSQDNIYKDEVEYCMSIIKNAQVHTIPHSIVCNKRDRAALNLEKSNIDTFLIDKYNAIIHALKSEISSGAKIFEVGCYIGVLGRIIKETFASNIQYLAASEIAKEAIQVAEAMNINNIPVYDKINLCQEISQVVLDEKNVYSIILIPDIFAYYCDLSKIFINVFASLSVGGVAIIAVRVVKIDDNPRDIEFIHPIEEFRYSHKYVISLASSYNLQLKNSYYIGNDFELFIFKKI